MFQRINSLWWKKATKTLFLQTLSCPLHGSKSAKEKWGFPNSFLFAYRCLFTCHPNIQKRAGSGELERGTSAEVCWLGQSLPRTNLKKDVQFTHNKTHVVLRVQFVSTNTYTVKSALLIKGLQCHFPDNLHSQLQETTQAVSLPRKPGFLHYKCLLHQLSY